MTSRFFSVKILKVFLFLSIVTTFTSYNKSIKSSTKDAKDKWEIVKEGDLDNVVGIDMRLPINFLVKPEIALSVKIPEDFRSFLPAEKMVISSMNEFFPKKDKNIDNWSEIITTQLLKGKQFTSKQFVDLLKKRFLSNNNNIDVKIISEQDNTLKKYSTSEFTMAYTYQGKREIIFTKYYSGPHDCSGFQYTIRLINGLSEDEALRKINAFVKDQVKLSGKFDPQKE